MTNDLNLNDFPLNFTIPSSYIASPLLTLYFLLTNAARFCFILLMALIVAAPLRSVVELAADADVLGTLSVRVAETLILSKGNPSS